MQYLIPFISAFVVYMYIYKVGEKEIRKRIDSINSLVDAMDKEDLIIDIVKDLKTDFNAFQKEIRRDMITLNREVTTLKTKAGMIAFVAAGISSGVMGLMFKLLS